MRKPLEAELQALVQSGTIDRVKADQVPSVSWSAAIWSDLQNTQSRLTVVPMVKVVPNDVPCYIPFQIEKCN